jgi:hypothetical protein
VPGLHISTEPGPRVSPVTVSRTGGNAKNLNDPPVG